MRRIWGLLKIFRRDLIVMILALFNRETPVKVKGLLLLAIAYLLSPFDIMPDTIPLAGLIDDAVILPAAICGLKNMLPNKVLQASETKAGRVARQTPLLIVAASTIILLWLALVFYIIFSLVK